MRKKFVQIAALLLVLTLLPVPPAAAQPENVEDMAGVEDTVDIGNVENPADTEDTGNVDDAADTEDAGDADNPVDTEDAGDTDDPAEAEDTKEGTLDAENTEGTDDAVDTENTENVEGAEGTTIRVGFYYDDSALPGANLQNYVGTGFQFGYMVDDAFVWLGDTSETKISMVKTQNVYYSNSVPEGGYGYSDQITSDIAVGCVHLRLNGTYSTFGEAKAAADAVGGFPAWIEGEYQVRIGAYTSTAQAESVAADLAAAGTDVSIVGTSIYGISVVITRTNQPIFQFDGGADHSMLVVKPGLDNSVKSITYFKKYKYYGSFRYERINGGNLTVVNLVELEDYIKGVIPYEMSPSWSIEALKAQAVCARGYTLTNINKHKSYHFDVCNTTNCQVYYGTGSANATTDQAVDETAGLCALYEGEIIEAYYHSSDGGATENVENVWNEALPYLRGVEDPFEALVADKIPKYAWTKTYTGKELQKRLHNLGYTSCGEIVDVRVSKVTDMGNVYSIVFTDVNGKTFTFSKYNLRSPLGVTSMRFTISAGGNGYSLTNDESVGSLSGTWVLDGNGNLVQMNSGSYYAITGSGVVDVTTPEGFDGTFVISGTGNGHNLGMSQWGAYAMAQEGYTYDEILKFYYTGVEIGKVE